MNRIKRIYVLCLILLLAMCSSVYAAEEAQPLPFVKGESGLDSEEQMGDKISVYYSTISLLGCISEYEKLSGVLTSYNSGESMRVNYGWEGYLEKARTDITDRLENGYPMDGKWEQRREVKVRRFDTVAVSFLECDLMHLGGPSLAGDMHSVFGRTIDAKTGKYLSLLTVFPDRELLASILEMRLRQNYPYAVFSRSPKMIDVMYFLDEGERALMNRNGGSMDAVCHENTATWTLEPEGATFYFNPGTIAPIREGVYVVKIFSDEIPDMFNPKYEHGAYGVECEYIPEEMDFIPKGGSAGSLRWEKL